MLLYNVLWSKMSNISITGTSEEVIGPSSHKPKPESHMNYVSYLSKNNIARHVKINILKEYNLKKIFKFPKEK